MGKQVEVAKGAASSLYGSDALGGIVVITTKDPSDYLKNNSSFVKMALGYQGQSNQVAADITAAKDLGDFAVSAVYSHRDSEEVQNYDENLPGYYLLSCLIKVIKGVFKCAFFIKLLLKFN